MFNILWLSGQSIPMLEIVLIQPEIPHNTGAIGRLCLATGARLHLVKPLGFSLDDRHLKRAGLDYWRNVDVRLWDSFDALRAEVPGVSFFYLSTKATKCYWEAQYPDKCWLVLGSESRGLPESLLQENISTCVHIPMQETRSLNLATAAGIVMYEVLRQHHQRGLLNLP